MNHARTSPLESGYFVHCRGQKATVFTTQGIYAVEKHFKIIWNLADEGSGLSVQIISYPEE